MTKPLPNALMTTAAALIALQTVPAAGGQPPAAPSPPNVVIIVADDLGRRDVGFNGGDLATPTHRPPGPRGRVPRPVLRRPGLLAHSRGADDRTLPHPVRPDAGGHSPVARLRDGPRRDDPARAPGRGRLPAPRHLRQVAPRPHLGALPPAAPRLHPVRRPLQRRHRLLHARARRRARLAARLRVGRRARLRHRPHRRARGPVHRRPCRRRRAVPAVRAVRRGPLAVPGQGAGPRPVRRPPRHRPAPRLAGGDGGRARAAGRPAHAEPARHRRHEPGPGRRHRPDSRPPRPPRRRGRHVRPVLLRQRRRGRGRRQPPVPGLEGDGVRGRHAG